MMLSFLKRGFSAVKSAIGKAVTYVAVAVVGLTMSIGAGDLFAQTGDPVVITPIVDFSGVFATIATTVGPVIVGAIGLGLSIWAVRFMFGLVKSMGRS
jgi:hypothetical protein